MKQFEYLEVEPPRFRTAEDLVTLLNSYGKDGWELVVWQDVSLVFKREVTA